MKNIPTILLALILLTACSPTEPTIDSFTDRWRLLTGSRSGVNSYDISAEVSSPSIVLSDNATTFPISSSVQFRNELYMLHSEKPIIIVVDATSLRTIDTIDLGANGPATDISFANASTAYATLPMSGSIGLIDLTVNLLVTSIATGGKPSGIDVLGTTVCYSLIDSNKVCFLDTRTNSITRRVPVGTAPRFVRADGLNNLFCVVSLGAGKIDNATKSVGTIAFIKQTDGSVLKTLDLTARAVAEAEQVPRGLVVTASETAFIPVQNGLLRINTRTRSRTVTAQQESFSLISYHEARASIILQRANSPTMIDIYDEFVDVLRTTVTVSDSVSAVLGIGPQ